MSQGNQSSLRFSLEESVWFEKGQEVSELISISLDPNITIQESDQYVSICGSLELTGEYNRYASQEETDEYTTSSNGKTVQYVGEREDSVNEFKHVFPVDVTIPINRVASIEEIDIQVSSFDYVLPERCCLKLTADLSITGIYGEQQSVPAEEAEEEEEYELAYRGSATLVEEEDAVDLADQSDSPEQEDLYTPFSAEGRLNPNEEEEAQAASYENNWAEQDTVPTFSSLTNNDAPERQDFSQATKGSDQQYEIEVEYEDNLQGYSASTLGNREEEVEDTYSNQNEAYSYEQEEVASFARNYHSSEENTTEERQRADSNVFEYESTLEEQQESEVEEEAPKMAVFNQEKVDYTAKETEYEQEETVVDFELEVEEESSSSSSSEEENIEVEMEMSVKTTKKKSKSKEEALSLTEFFARKEEEELTKLTVCIVQQGETLHEVADRYAVNLQQLLKVNHLEGTESVAEGQVLYIPTVVLK